MFSRGIVLSVVLLLASASGARAQILTFTPSPDLAASRTLWVTVETSTAGSVAVAVRDSDAALAAPEIFTFAEPGEVTRKIGLNRVPRSAVSVEFQPKPASPTAPGMIRRAGASMQPYRRTGTGGVVQETAFSAAITEAVECNAMICRMCYTLAAESNVEADSLASPARTMTHNDFAMGQNKAPNQPHHVQWNEDDQRGSHVTGSYLIQLTTTSAAGSTKSESRAFLVPGNPFVPSPGGRCPNP